MDTKPFSVVYVNSRRGFGFAGNDAHENTIFFHFADVSGVYYDAMEERFEFTGSRVNPLSSTMNAWFRTPRVGDLLKARLGKDNQGRQRLTPWTFLEHFEEVEAQLPRCSKEGCKNILGYRDNDRCWSHDPRNGADEPVSWGEVYGRALTLYGGNTEQAHEAASQFPGDFI